MKCRNLWFVVGGVLSIAAVIALGLGRSCALSSPLHTASASGLMASQLGSARPVHFVNCVYLTGQPSAEDFETARQAGIKTVVDLRAQDELEWDEGSVVRGLGLEYHRIPFDSPESLTQDVFSQVRALLNDWRKRPLLLHCRTANRVAAVWLAHRVLDAGLSYEQALAEARQVGLQLTEYEQTAQTYIEQIQRQSTSQRERVPMTHIANVSTDDFAGHVLRSEQPVVVDFYAPWCGPCRMIAPVLDQLAHEFRGRVKIVKVNVDQEPDLAAEYGISGVPTLLFFREGTVEDQLIGAVSPDALRNRIARLASVCSTMAANTGE